MAGRLHHDEIDSDVDLVGRLLEKQLPQWADLPIERVSSTGTDNAMYRLGDDMVGAPAPAPVVGRTRRQGAPVVGHAGAAPAVGHPRPHREAVRSRPPTGRPPSP